MATGIGRNEQVGEDALTAVLPSRDPHPLPSADAVPFLSYPGRTSETEVLKPLVTSFEQVRADGSASPSKIGPNSFVLADNLYALHGLIASGGKATLIYMDPPYNTGMDFQSRLMEHAYKDQRHASAYVEFMRRRLILAREALAEDGSIYVHIGHQMLSHLKVLMDEIFGTRNFRNIITRRKCSSKNFTKHQYLNLNDYVIFYTKSDKYKWNRPGIKPEQEWIEREYPKVDSKGRYKLVPIHAPGVRNGASGGPWRGMMPPPGKHWQFVPERLDEFDRAGEMHWSRNGNPRRKVYLTPDKMVPFTDYWEGFRDAHHQSIAITGYPTEKNLEMLRMIVSASSDPGDLVVDPFSGSGTTAQAASDLGRRWIGIDQSFSALKASVRRFRHGSEPMGDYIVKATGKNTADNIVDLFGVGVGVGVGVTAATPVGRKKANGDFNFLVDQGILDTYRDEICAIASI